MRRFFLVLIAVFVLGISGKTVVSFQRPPVLQDRPQETPPYTPGALPNESQWWSMMAQASSLLHTKLSGYTHPTNDDDGLTHVYYDTEYGAYVLADHFSDTATYYPRANAGSLWYLDYYVLDMVPQGQVQGYRQFPEGLAERFIRQADADAKTGVEAILVNGAFTASGDLSDDLLSRECAYGLDTHLEAPRVGTVLSGAQTTRRTNLKNWSLGHIDQWADAPQTADYYRPFMGGLTARSLIRYYTDVSQDAAIVTSLQKLAAYTWSCCWNSAANAFNYTDQVVDGPDDLTPTPDLGMLVFPMYAWLWKITGDGNYWVKANQIFQGAIPVYSGAAYVSGAYLGSFTSGGISGKQFNQQLFWGGKGVTWLGERATGSMFPVGVPTPTPTATPDPGTLDDLINTSAPKGWFDGDHGITESGGAISAWASRAGSITFTAAGAAQPTLTTDSGFNVVQFDGSSDYLGTTSQMTALVGASAKTVLLVFKNSATSGHHMIFGTGTGTFGFFYNIFTGNGDFNVDNYDGSYDSYTQQTANTNLNLLEINHNGTTLSSRINHGSLGSVSSGASTSTTNTWAIGAGTDGSNKWNGNVYLLVTWDRVLDETEFGPIRTAAATKYGITLN